jgi:hypothetical protein
MNDANSVSEQLVRRIERLERQNQTLRRYLTVAAALAVIGAVALTAFEAASQTRAGATVESNRFVLRNPEGKIVAALGVNSYGTANLVLLDKQERMRATIGVNDNGDPAFVLANPEGQQRLTLIHTSDGPGMIMLDQNNKPRLLVSIEADGRGLFQIIDKDGNATWTQQ